MRALLALYPPAWRRRYATEFAALLDEQRPSLGLVLDVVLGAIDAHLDPQLADEGETSLRRRMKDVVMKSLRSSTALTKTVAAAAATVGGLILAGVAAAAAARPEGRSGAYRQTDDLGPFVLVSVMFIAIAAAALSRSGLARGASGLVGAGLSGLGTAAVLVVIAYAVVTGGLGSLWWVLFLGFLLLVAGSAVTGAALAAARAIPAPTAYALIATALAFLFFNTEDARAWLGVPFGLAWSWVGLTVLLRSRAPAALTLT